MLTFLAFYKTRNKCYFNNGCELWLKSTCETCWPGAGGIGIQTNSAPNDSWIVIWAELGKNMFLHSSY